MTTTSTTDSDAAKHAHFCPSCGTERQAVEPFCAHCGHVFPDAEAAAAPVAAAEPAAGATTAPAAAAAGTNATAPTAPNAPETTTDRRTVILIAIGAAVAVIAVIVTLVVLLTGDDDSSSAQDATAETTWLALVGESVDDLEDDRDSMQAAIDSQPVTSASAAAVTTTTAQYRATLDEWRDDVADLEDEARPSSSERKLIAAAIDAEQELLTAITRITRTPSAANRSEVARLADASAAAWKEARDESDGDVDVDPIDVDRLTAWSLRREQQRAARLRAQAAERAAAVRRAEQAAAAARAAAAAAAEARSSASGYQSCANIGEGGAGAINIEGTNVSCDEMYSIIYAVPPSQPSSYNAGGFYCEAMDSDASSIAYICQDGDRSFGFRIIDN